MFLFQKNPEDRREENMWEYKMEAKIQIKMRLDKCGAYTAKETLGYSGRKSYVSEEQHKEEKQRVTGEELNLQENYWSTPIKRRDEPIKNRNEKMKKRKETPIEKTRRSNMKKESK